MVAGPLSRFTVLDLTRVRAGPTCVRYFADWGANCIKVEMPPSAGEQDMGGPRHGPDFQNLHRNKKSITLNLKEPEGKAIFMKMRAPFAAMAAGMAFSWKPSGKSRNTKRTLPS